MGGELFADRAKRAEEFQEMEKELSKSVRLQHDVTHTFGRLMLEQHIDKDRSMKQTAEIVEKAAVTLQTRERISALDEDITELDTHMCPLEESFKHRKNRLDAVAKTKTKNTDVDHVSLALRREILVDRKAALEHKDSPAPADPAAAAAALEKRKVNELLDCVAALKKLDPEADFTGEDYITDHAAELHSLIKNGETFSRLSALSRTDGTLSVAISELSETDRILCGKFSKMAVPAKAAMGKLCRLKGIDPATGEFAEKPLDKKEKARLQAELLQHRQALQAEAADTAKYKKEKFRKKEPTPAEEAAKRQKLAQDLAERQRKRETALKEAQARQRIQKLVDIYKNATPKDMRERKEVEIGRAELKILYRMQDEKTATHLLLSLDILRTMGKELDALKDRRFLEEECVNSCYEKDFGEKPDEAIRGLLRKRSEEITERETEYNEAFTALEQRIAALSPPLAPGQTEEMRIAAEQSRFETDLDNLTPGQKVLLSPAQQRRTVRNLIVRGHRAVTMAKLEERKEVNTPKERIVDETETAKGHFLDLAAGTHVTYTQLGIRTSYDLFKYLATKDHEEVQVPPQEEMEEILHDYLKTLVEKNLHMQIRVPNCEILGAILETGRFMTQIETGTTKGSKDVDGRKKLAKEKFGIDPATFPDRDYEVYGYLSDGDHVREGKFADSSRRSPADDNHLGWVGSYGQIIVKLKAKRMLTRTTISFGDSLDTEENSSPALLDNPDVMCVRQADRHSAYEQAYEWHKKKMAGDERGAAELEGLNAFMGHMENSSYVELQFHGGVTLEDIESVTLVPKLEGSQLAHEAETDIPPEMVRDLQARGIHAFVVEGDQLVERSDPDAVKEAIRRAAQGGQPAGAPAAPAPNPAGDDPAAPSAP